MSILRLCLVWPNTGSIITAAVPGAATVLRLAAHPYVLAVLNESGERLSARGVEKGAALRAIAQALRQPEGHGSREAFLHTLRAVIDGHGQRVSARDRLYLLGGVPTLIVWGERDRTIPLAHGRDAHELIRGSRFETLPRAAHFPHIEDPDGLAAALRDFLETTRPALIEDADWGAIVARRSPRSSRLRGRRLRSLPRPAVDIRSGAPRLRLAR